MKLPPIRIKNPDTPCRVVRLQQGQQIELLFDYEPKLSLYSDYLRIVKTDNYTDKSIWYIKQTENTQGSNLCSTFYLGEISSSKGSLLVYLDTEDPSKRDIITIVNPGYDTVRLKPYQVLEVVCYHPDFVNNDDHWVWEWAADSNIRMDQLGYDFAVPFYFDSFTQDSLYSVIPRVIGDFRCVQHHFWFRFDQSILEVLSRDQMGKAKYVGKLAFRGYPSPKDDCYVESVIDVLVDGNKKHINKCVQTLGLPTHNLYEPKEIVKTPIMRDVVVTKVDASLDIGWQVIQDQDAI